MIDNDPYAIYGLVGKYVSVNVPERFGRDSFEGVVEFAYKNPLDRQVELVVAGVQYVFPLPDVITKIDGDIAFVYGKLEKQEESVADDDEALMGELRSIAIDGGNIDDAIKNLEIDNVVIIWLRIKKS